MNYGDIKTAVTNIAVRSDLTAYMSTFTKQAESDIRSDVRVPEMEATATLSLTSRTVALPTGCLGVRRIVIDRSTAPWDLDYLPPNRLYSAAAYHESGGNPFAYTIEGTNLVFAPAPADNPNALVHYYKAFDAFSLDADTNALSTDHPNVYIYGMLKYVGIFLHDTEKAGLWSQLYASAVSKANGEAMRRRRGPRSARTGVSTP